MRGLRAGGRFRRGYLTSSLVSVLMSALLIATAYASSRGAHQRIPTTPDATPASMSAAPGPLDRTGTPWSPYLEWNLEAPLKTYQMPTAGGGGFEHPTSEPEQVDPRQIS